MRKTNSLFSLASSILTILTATSLYAQTEVTTKDRKSVAITVYNNDLGIVRDVRALDLRSGENEVRLRDVPVQINPTTVKITSLKHPDAIGVTEQNYEYDLVSQEKLLLRYVDQQITVVDEKGTALSGILLAVERDKLTLQTPSGITMLPNLTRYSINVPKLAAGLITKPTLVWKVESDKAFVGEPLEVLYQTGGMAWHAEYIVALSSDDKKLDLSGWVSLENRSGATFENADLKLVAGAIHRVQNEEEMDEEARQDDPFGMFGGSKRRAQFEERGMFEYHLYDLGRQTTLQNNQIKQISLLEAGDVKATKKYSYRGGRNVEVTVEFENKQTNNMGMPLPEGIVRVMKKDKDGSLEFVGEDRIEHTPRDETITLKVGDAFDVLGERKIIDQRNLGPNSSQQTIEITLKNRKDTDEKIEIIEQVGGSAEIMRHSHEFTKKDANTIVFPVTVKARSEEKVTFTVLYSYR
jgi:hypothetical protein